MPDPRSSSSSRLPPLVANGEVCAWCTAPFTGAHGKPVYCEKCYDNALATRKSFGLLPKATLPLKEQS
jgi:hypothetical protein